LNTGEHEIRLVRAASQEINCHLETANLDLSPSHEALSYEWGAENSAEREAILDSGRVSVRENMWWAALYHLRNELETRVLWIDAICINQVDIRTKLPNF
jgi:hypothetical protein